MVLNIYDSFFGGISPNDWEFFAEDFLFSIGYQVFSRPSVGADGGEDLIVEKGGIKYIVSCKHNIISGKSVGTAIEASITDRMFQHEAQGFIGFYSTEITKSLSDRLDSLGKHDFKSKIFDKSIISNCLPKISSQILQKYGLPNSVKFTLNVNKEDYSSLLCLGCETDILDDTMINRSMALICLSNSDELEYIYGCKSCCAGIIDRGWVEVSQALHQEQLNGWIKFVNDDIKYYSISKTFYKHRSEFEGAIQQRMFPSNWGQWSS